MWTLQTQGNLYECIILFEFQNNTMRLLSPFYKWENLLKKLSNLPKVMMHFYHLYQMTQWHYSGKKYHFGGFIHKCR